MSLLDGFKDKLILIIKPVNFQLNTTLLDSFYGTRFNTLESFICSVINLSKSLFDTTHASKQSIVSFSLLNPTFSFLLLILFCTLWKSPAYFSCFLPLSRTSVHHTKHVAKLTLEEHVVELTCLYHTAT